jgi:hypothetical protein
MGRVVGKDGSFFQADLEWLIRPNNFVKVIEGRYHRNRVSDPLLYHNLQVAKRWLEKKLGKEEAEKEFGSLMSIL